MSEQIRKVTLYALSTCNHCQALREFLEENEVPYDCIEVDGLFGKERREMIKLVRTFNRKGSFPTTVIDSRVVVGFREDELREALAL